MATVSMPAEQPPLNFLNPDTITEDPPLLAAGDAFYNSFWLSLQGDDRLSTTLPSWNSEDNMPNISSSGSNIHNNQPNLIPCDEKDPNAGLFNIAECRLSRSPTLQLDCPQRRSYSNSKSSNTYNRRKSSIQSSRESDTHRDENPSKRAKFLERNRLATSRCRQKKKERTIALESRYQEQREKKDALMAEFGRLRSKALGLKNEVLKHADCGDKSIRLHIARFAMTITDNDIVPELANPADLIPSPETLASSKAPMAHSFNSPDQLLFGQRAARSLRPHTRQYSDQSQGSMFDRLSIRDCSSNLVSV